MYVYGFFILNGLPFLVCGINCSKVIFKTKILQR